MGALAVGNFNLYFDEVAKFYNFIFIRGWLHSRSDTNRRKIQYARLIGTDGESWISVCRLNHEREDLMSEAAAFEIQGLKTCGVNDLPEFLELNIDTGEKIIVNVGAAIQTGRDSFAPSLSNSFFGSLKPGDFVLDIGGRARSGKRTYIESCGYDLQGVNIVTLDIVPDDGVDIVGDAHELSNVVKGRQFDAILCVSVFEHLLMPWKVVLEMNKVLKLGGLHLFILINLSACMICHGIIGDFLRMHGKGYLIPIPGLKLWRPTCLILFILSIYFTRATDIKS